MFTYFSTPMQISKEAMMKEFNRPVPNTDWAAEGDKIREQLGVVAIPDKEFSELCDRMDREDWMRGLIIRANNGDKEAIALIEEIESWSC